MLRRLIVLTLGILYTGGSDAQPFRYDRNYFRNPLHIPLSLSANFGELRPDHWHMGLDLRTDQKENLPVHAAADGYISHAGVRPKSFGRFLVIRHPNGLSTLYAHLNDFFPELEAFVTAEQYRRESWALELDLTPEQFPVTGGAFIAWSGNTGGSQGPHLHFEVLDTRTEKRLNPLLFDFGLSDKEPPQLLRLALYDRSRSIYEQQPVLYPLRQTDSGWIIPKLPLIRTGHSRIGLAIQAIDRMGGSKNPNGIYAARVLLDGLMVSSFSLDSLGYDETAYINAHIDYRNRYQGGAYLQLITPLPGDRSPGIRILRDGGVLRLSDTLPHPVTIEVSDAAGNNSVLRFALQRTDSLVHGVGQVANRDRFLPAQVNVSEHPGFEVYLPEGALYDTVAPRFLSEPDPRPTAFSPVFRFGDPSIPLHEDLVVRIRLERPVPEAWQDKLLIRRWDAKGSSFRKAQWQEQWVSARFGEFGSFQVLADVEPPRIEPLGSGKKDTLDLSPATRIVLSPTDDFGIRSFRAELDSQWIRFTNDKGRQWVYVFDERCPYGIHHLKVTVDDWAGNQTIRQWWFRRAPYTPPPPRKKSGKKGKKGKSK